MTVGQLREHLAGLPGDLEVHVEDTATGRSVAAGMVARHPAAIVIASELDPDETAAATMRAVAGRMVPIESPADSQAPELEPIDGFARDADGNYPDGTVYLYEAAHGSYVADRHGNEYEVIGYGPVQGSVELEDEAGGSGYVDVTVRVRPVRVLA